MTKAIGKTTSELDRPTVTEADLEALSRIFENNPLEELADGSWHPTKHSEIAYALSLLAQEHMFTVKDLSERVETAECILGGIGRMVTDGLGGDYIFPSERRGGPRVEVVPAPRS